MPAALWWSWHDLLAYPNRTPTLPIAPPYLPQIFLMDGLVTEIHRLRSLKALLGEWQTLRERHAREAHCRCRVVALNCDMRAPILPYHILNPPLRLTSPHSSLCRRARLRQEGLLRGVVRAGQAAVPGQAVARQGALGQGADHAACFNFFWSPSRTYLFGSLLSTPLGGTSSFVQSPYPSPYPTPPHLPAPRPSPLPPRRTPWSPRSRRRWPR